MANKTKKQHKQCRKKTVKKSHISEIKKLNSNYDDFIKHNLSKSFQNTLVKEFNNRNILDYSTVPTKNNKYSYTYTIKKNDNYGIYYYTSNEANKTRVLINCKKMAKNKTFFNMNELDISSDETYVAFSIDYNGDNTTTLYLKNIDTEKETVVTNKGGGGYCISPDSKLLYYVICDSQRPDPL